MIDLRISDNTYIHRRRKTGAALFLLTFGLVGFANAQIRIACSAEFKLDYLAMIDTLATLPKKPRVFVILPLPIRGNNDATLVKANAIIKEVALARGLTVIDCYTPFSGQAQLYHDGLHPNAVGADTMAHIIYRLYPSRRPPFRIIDRLLREVCSPLISKAVTFP